jgi:hypothetical protein
MENQPERTSGSLLASNAGIINVAAIVRWAISDQLL